MKNIFKKLNYANWAPAIRRLVNIFIGFHIFGYPYKKLKIIGVTGTNGKTTITTLLYKIATALGYEAGLIGTVEHIIAGRKIPTDFTTPEGLQLNKLLSYNSNQNNDNNQKQNFFKILPKTAFALSNADDAYGNRILEGTKAIKKLYGFTKAADFKGKIKKIDFNGLELDFGEKKIKSKLIGKFNAYNLLAVWGTCSLLGFDMSKVNKILENIEPPRGRFQHFTSPSGVLVIVDYAHTPDALEKVLLTIGELKSKEASLRPDDTGKIISVFGCGGDRDSSKRSKMGRIGVVLSDIPIFTSDNPRSEDPNKIIANMIAGLYPEEIQKVKSIPNRREAIKEAVRLAHGGDVILCAGKGHENYQEIKGVKNHFDDLEELKSAFFGK